MVAVGVPEPKYHILLWESVRRNPVLGVGRLVGVGHVQFLPNGTNERLLKEFHTLPFVRQFRLRGPWTFAGQIVSPHQVAPRGIPPDIFGGAVIFRHNVVHEVTHHKRICLNSVE